MMEVEWNIESVNCRLQVCLFYERGHMITHQGKCGEHEGRGGVVKRWRRISNFERWDKVTQQPAKFVLRYIAIALPLVLLLLYF